MLLMLAASAGHARGQSEGRAETTLAPLTSAREMLTLLGVDDSHFRLFTDGTALDVTEQEPLLRVLYAARRFSPADLERWSENRLPEPANANEARGNLFRLEGKVLRVTRESPLPEAARRFEIEHFYRCQLQLEQEQTFVTVFALDVPTGWPIDEEISEQVSVSGFFLKFSSDDGSGEPVFAARRIAWHAGKLGEQGFDAGLFDLVKNKAPILAQERECFYQLLAAAGRLDADTLYRQTFRQPDDDYSVVPLFNDAANQHGKLVALTGTARRAMLVKLDARQDAEIIERFGFDHYFQIEIFTADSQSNPIVFCVRALPEGMPQGPNIYEHVRIPGFFFKTWAYDVQGTQEQPVNGKQLAPMLIGHQPTWLKPPSAHNPYAGAIAGVFFLLFLAGLGAAIWLWNSSDRKFRQRAIARHFEPEHDSSLNELKIETASEPDFRNLP